MPVDVWSDVSCPWCYIGHHRLHEAIAAEPPGTVAVRPRAFELHPELPAEGIPIEDYYPRHFASVEAMSDDLGRVADAAAAAGVEIRFDRMKRAPNTRLAHRLVAIASRDGQGAAALDALFRGHFRDGADVAVPEQAAGLVAAAVPGLDADGLRRALEAGEGEREVAAEEGLAGRMGITGVPFFVAGQAVALSGAHDTATFRDLLRAARQRAEADAAG
jgi:predicted DsbA family dithiol-disulfide isomerase